MSAPRPASGRGQSRGPAPAPSAPSAGGAMRSPWSSIAAGHAPAPAPPAAAASTALGDKLKMQRTGERAPRAGTPSTHPLKRDWTVYYVHRPPGSKVVEYEKEIKRVASFGSTESFWPIYSHLARPSALPPVTDLLLFSSRIRRPVWEELPSGGKWVVRLRKGVADRLWEDAVLALIGDQFDDDEGIVGMVLSSRSQEDILSVWSDREGDNMAAIRDKLFSILSLPPATTVDYKSNKSLLESATQKANGFHPNGTGAEGEAGRHDAPERERERPEGRGYTRARDSGTGGAGRGAPERRQIPRERPA